MTFAGYIGIAAAAAAVIQIVLMGFIGYPIARRRPGGMAAFHRSGFTWWMIVLVLLSALGLLLLPATNAWTYPTLNKVSVEVFFLISAAAFIVCLSVELVSERIRFGAGDRERHLAEIARYEGSLPEWARSGGAQYALLITLAVLEEFVFRAVALGSLLYEWDLPKWISAGIVVVAFGLSHWYFGLRQIVIKLVLGSALVWAALSGGWIAAALSHVALNITLVAISNRRSRKIPTS